MLAVGQSLACGTEQDSSPLSRLALRCPTSSPALQAIAPPALGGEELRRWLRSCAH